MTDIEFLGTSLHVSSIDESLKLYRDLLGCTVFEDTGWLDEPQILAISATPGASIRIARLTSAGGAPAITLIEMRDIDRQPDTGRFQDPGTMHFAVRVASLEETSDALADAGYRRLADPGTVSGRLGSARIGFFRDRDGFPIELVEILSDGDPGT